MQTKLLINGKLTAGGGKDIGKALTVASGCSTAARGSTHTSCW